MPSTYHRQHQSLYIEYFYCNYYKVGGSYISFEKKKYPSNTFPSNQHSLSFLFGVCWLFKKIRIFFSPPFFSFPAIHFFLSGKTRGSDENIFPLKHPHVLLAFENIKKYFQAFHNTFSSLISPSLLDLEDICRPLKIYSPV